MRRWPGGKRKYRELGLFGFWSEFPPAKMKFNWLLCIECSIICAVIIGRSDGAITEWTEPPITGKDGSAAAATKIPESTGVGTTGVTLAATGTGTLTYSIVLQPTAGKLTIASGGLLSLASGFSFDFETEPTYVIVVKCDESGTATDSGTATVTLSITDVNEAPEFADSQYSLTLPDGSTAGTTLTTVTATDQDTDDTISYSIDAASNTNTDFAISSSGVITVATGKTLTQSTTGSYGLVVYAVDNDASPLTGSTTVNVVVKANGASTAMVGVMTLTLVAISMFV